jgi:hypothetical protein
MQLSGNGHPMASRPEVKARALPLPDVSATVVLVAGGMGADVDARRGVVEAVVCAELQPPTSPAQVRNASATRHLTAVTQTACQSEGRRARKERYKKRATREGVSRSVGQIGTDRE